MFFDVAAMHVVPGTLPSMSFCTPGPDVSIDVSDVRPSAVAQRIRPGLAGAKPTIGSLGTLLTSPASGGLALTARQATRVGSPQNTFVLVSLIGPIPGVAATSGFGTAAAKFVSRNHARPSVTAMTPMAPPARSDSWPVAAA